MKKIIILITLFLAMPESALSYTHYVRSGAAGNNNGTDWTNAYTSLPNNLVRGDTYYIASGNYGTFTINEPESGSTYIYIKKATALDHGSEIGWMPSYGVGVANIDHIVINYGYVEIDGQVGGGPGSWDSGHGFNVMPADRDNRPVWMHGSQVSGYVTLAHMNIHNFPDTATRATMADADFGHAVYQNRLSGTTDNVTIKYCYIHHQYGCFILMRRWKDPVFEYNYFYYNKATAAFHSEPISTHGGSGHVWRYNIFSDGDGTGCIVNLNLPTTGWKVYGNVFYNAPAGYSHGIITTNTTPSAMTSTIVVNNTVVDNHTNWSTALLRILSPGSSGNYAYNNLFYRNDPPGVLWGGSLYQTQDYSYYYSSDLYSGSYEENDYIDDTPGILWNYSETLNFTPTRAAVGIFLADEYNTDMFGNIRGADGAWDIGAIEYQSNVTRPNPPTRLRIQ